MSHEEHKEDGTATDADFPWDLGVFDAHCHPTDTMASIAEIPQMKASTLTIMATRGEDQELVFQAATTAKKESTHDGIGIKEERILPCFGWHPWFSYQILDDTAASTVDDKKTHYKKVLTPFPKDDSSDSEAFITALPPPKPLSHFLAETRTRLHCHPTALIGEIGLDRAFRLPNPWTPQDFHSRDAQTTPGSREGRTLSPYRVQLEHQKIVLRAQLVLAGEMQRPVSLHSVQAHGVVFDLLKELWRGYERKIPTRRERRRRYSAAGAHDESDAEENEKKSNEDKKEDKEEKKALPFPPRICMHSYSGPVDPVKQFLHPSNPSDVYFSFSNVINFSGSSAQKVINVIKALPDDRVLVESDLHTAGPVMDGLLEDVVRQVCEIRGWPLVQGVQQLGDNWKRFVFGNI